MLIEDETWVVGEQIDVFIRGERMPFRVVERPGYVAGGGVALILVPERPAEKNQTAHLIATTPSLLRALQWAASALQGLAHVGRVTEADTMTAPNGQQRTIGEILDAADAAIGQTKPAQV